MLIRRRGRGRAREEEENEEGGMEVDGVNGEAAAPIPGLDLVPQNMETEDLEESKCRFDHIIDDCI